MERGSAQKYSITWAESIVEQLHTKHTRGTEDLCKLLCISMRQLACFLANNDPLWPHLRNLVKYLDSCHLNPKFKPDEAFLRSILAQTVKKRNLERITKRLDDVAERQLRLELQE